MQPLQSAMILAAGEGMRMRPLTLDLPKPLIPVAGRCFLDRSLDHLRQAGIKNIVVNASYLKDKIARHCEPYKDVTLSLEDTRLETGGGVKKALPLLGPHPFYILNGDGVWVAPSLMNQLAQAWDPEKMEALLMLTPLARAHGYEGAGDFVVDADHRLARAPGGHVYVGVQIISPTLYEGIEEDVFSNNLVWDKALARGTLYGHLLQGEMYHIGTPEDLQKFEPLVARSEQVKMGIM